MEAGIHDMVTERGLMVEAHRAHTPSEDPPKLSIVLMAYNEAESLEATTRELLSTMQSLGIPAEVVIIDDGSTDGTGLIARRLAKCEPKVRLVSHISNRGLGEVYRTGFTEARGEFVTFFPADGQFPAGILNDFVKHMASADLVLGYVSEGRRPFLGRMLSWGERLLYRILVGPMPPFQGVMMVRRSVLARIPILTQGRGWGPLMEMIVRISRGPYRIVSLPTPVRPRRQGSSKVQNVRTILSNTRQLVELAWELRWGKRR